ncbi:transposase [Enterococcus faecalis]|uniref:transposase n=1 Tax=Enterococcus faecalis TaxID=1351 RepID=UPI0024C447E4|nr:transposase [Enterococcus sp. LX10]
MVDGLENLVSFQLSSGNIYDGSYAIHTLSNININGYNILANKAYNSSAIREFIKREGATYTISPKSNAKEKWTVDWNIYKERHLIERFFCKIKQFHRIATRYEKLMESFIGFIYLVTIFILKK